MSESYNELLIEAVKECPCLYDKQDKRYMDKNYKNHCWVEIASKVNKTCEECKTRWRHLRETFSRKCKPKGTGSGADDEGWPYFELLLFLKPFIQPRKTRNNENVDPLWENEELLEEQTVAYESFQPSQTLEVGPVPKRKCTIESALNSIEEAATAVKNNALVSQQNMGGTREVEERNSTDAQISKTILSLLNEIPAQNKDKVRAELFQFIFALKKTYGT